MDQFSVEFTGSVPRRQCAWFPQLVISINVLEEEIFAGITFCENRENFCLMEISRYMVSRN